MSDTYTTQQVEVVLDACG